MSKGQAKLRVRDNGGKTPDRYTFIIAEDDDCLYFYSFSDLPFSSNGINHFCGSSEDGLSDGDHLGPLVQYQELEESLQRAMFERYSELQIHLANQIKKQINHTVEKRSNYPDTAKYDELIQALEESLAKLMG